MQYGFGIDIGGTTVKIAYFNENRELLDKWEIPTRREKKGTLILPDIAASVKEYLTARGASAELGAGVAVPGPVDENGNVNRCVNLGWDRLNVEAELSRLLGLPVRAGNDATLAALGECCCGGGKGCDSMVLITLGTGVGGGVVVGGKVIRGTHGAGGEIGHIILEPGETEFCSCGNRGCAEQYCSATGLVRLAKKRLCADDAPSLLRRKKDLDAKAVFDAAGENDPVAQEILEQYYDYLGRLIAAVCAVTDPRRIVLGGGVSKAGTTLLDGVRRHFERHAFHAVHPAEIVCATLGNDAGAYGAFSLMK